MTFMLVMASCDRSEDELLPDNQVRLKASLSPVLSAVYTKGGEITSSYDGTALDIGLARVVGDGGFDGADNNVHTAVMTPDESGLWDIDFNDFQAYPTGNLNVNYIGWYPNAGAEFSNPADGRTTVTIPVDGSTDILYSDVATGNRLGGFNTMTFRHALVKYSVRIYGTEEVAGSVNNTWGSVSSVVFKNMPDKCVLTLPQAPKNGGQPAVPEISSLESPKDLGLETSGPVDIPIGFSNAEDMGYLLAPAPENNILNISVTTSVGGVKDLELSISSNFQPGKHYQIYLRFAPEGIVNAEVKVGGWIDGDEIDVEDPDGKVYYDLSETHTANTYIVSAPNSYCFNVTVRGNGPTGIAGIPGADMNLYRVGDPVSAEIVWTDLVGPSDNMDDYFTLSPEVVDGRAFITVKPVSESSNHLKKEGNVVIGVKDAAGNMLWTWHIWITDRPAEQGYKNGFSVQDRDLGAIAYAPTENPGTINGFYYQWGRPTPLPLGKTVYKPNYNETTGDWENKAISFLDISKESIPVINRVAAPTTYFTMPATTSDALLTKSLWGWRSETDEYAKTIYDPCPPGYRVPSIKLWRDLSINDAASADGAVSFDIAVSELEVYYPMTGYYRPFKEGWSEEDIDWAEATEYKLFDNGTGAYMWAATYDLGSKKDDASDDHPYALDFATENSVLKPMETRVEVSNYAMPVRCVSRMSKAHVTDLSAYQTANSYIVSKKGYYKFKATVRGNGIGKLVPPGSTSAIDLMEGIDSVGMKNKLVKVEPLWWHSYNKPEAPDTDHFTMLNGGVPDADGYVSFMVEHGGNELMSEGNMILAGYDAKGAIIWSWHIWFTEEPQMMKSNSFVVMDRNLGATHAPAATTEPTGTDLSETYGFYYQWGRKDPFVRPESGTKVCKYDPENGVWSQPAEYSEAFGTETDVSDKTVVNSVADPMTYHLASDVQNNGVFNDAQMMQGTFTVNDADNASASQCFSTMIRPEDRQSLWGYSATSGYGVTTTKTMYDPCPPGYIVAHYLVWTNTEKSAYNLYYSGLDGGFRNHNIGGTSGIFLTNDDYADKFDPAWYPFSGYIQGDEFELGESGSIGVFHTSTPAGNGSRSLMYDSNNSGQAVDGNYRGLPSSFGYPVRCQKE